MSRPQHPQSSELWIEGDDEKANYKQQTEKCTNGTAA
jgi:hypothetical protein